MLQEKVLVIDGNDASRRTLSQALSENGFSVMETDNEQCVRKEWLDGLCVAVLNVEGSPQPPFDVVRQFSRRWPMVGLMLLMNHSESSDRTLGFELGVDDFLDQPVDPRELSARVRAFMRRMRQFSDQSVPEAPANTPQSIAASSEIVFFGWYLSIDEQRLTSPTGAVVTLTTTESSILMVLAEMRGHPVNRQTLYQAVRGREWSPLDRSLDTHVANLRRKLSRCGGDRLIRTVHGHGYRLMSV